MVCERIFIKILMEMNTKNSFFKTRRRKSTPFPWPALQEHVLLIQEMEGVIFFSFLNKGRTFFRKGKE